MANQNSQVSVSEPKDLYGQHGCCRTCIDKDNMEGVQYDIWFNGKHYDCMCLTANVENASSTIQMNLTVLGKGVTRIMENESFKEDIIDFTFAVEAACVKLRGQLNKTKEGKPISPLDRTKLPFDVSKIQWQDRENEKGKFQVSEDLNNLDHKALLKFLSEHTNGSVTSEGYFYWTYQNGTTIGRKEKALVNWKKKQPQEIAFHKRKKNLVRCLWRKGKQELMALMDLN